jgi:hypothetical protein
MRKAIGLTLTVWAVLAAAGWALGDEPKPAAKKVEPKPAAKKEKESVKQSVQDRQDQRIADLKAAVAAASPDFDKALSILDEMLNDKEVSNSDRLRADILKCRILAGPKKDCAKACPLAKKIAEAKKANPKWLEETPLAHVLNALAWIILDSADLKGRDLDLAMTLAKQAAEESKQVDPAILDTLARACFEKGDLAKAIEWQTKAVAKCEVNDKMPAESKTSLERIRHALTKTLEKYKSQQSGKKSNS